MKRMKGVFEFTETFLKMLNTAYLAVMLLGIFFAINNYYLYFTDSESNRDVMTLTDGMLSAACLVETENGQPIKALFSETKLDYDKNGVSCVKFGKAFTYSVLDPNMKILYSSGDTHISSTGHSSLFPASMKTSSGEVKQITLNVTVG